MEDSGEPSRTGFLQIRASVWLVILASLAVLAVLLVVELRSPPPSPQETKPPVQTEAAKKPVAPPAPEAREEEEDESDGPEFEEAHFVSELTVELDSLRGLGQISVEKYDENGRPTGEPLKSGTQVQIPDPDRPGKKIYFKVP